MSREKQLIDLLAIDADLLRLIKNQMANIATKIERDTTEVVKKIISLYQEVSKHKKQVDDVYENIYLHQESHAKEELITKMNNLVDQHLDHCTGNNKESNPEDILSMKLVAESLKKFNQQLEDLGKQDEKIVTMARPLLITLQFNDGIRQGVERSIRAIEIIEQLNQKEMTEQEIKEIARENPEMDEIIKSLTAIFTHEDEKMILAEHYNLKFEKKDTGKTLIF